VNPYESEVFGPDAVGGNGASPFGASPAMRSVLARVVDVAATRRHVLIGGEPGTDYEGVAREIHRRGSSSGPFVKVDYTSQSPEALELNLFGYHTAGRAGNGQERRTLERIAKGGLLHRAIGGTIFFEQLTEMPARVQAKLARLFRDGEVVVISDKRPLVTDTQAIAAVEDGYDDAVREGRVRDDLHRLFSRSRIDIPPLRDRREDIPLLARRSLEEVCRDANLPPKRLSESAAYLLSALPWSRNEFEFNDLLRKLAFRVESDTIDLPDVLGLVRLDGQSKPVALGGTLREARDSFEREYITAVLKQHHGRVPDAARTLGIQRTNLYRKLRRLKLNQNGGKS
jgi:DNA-binding NtrC family response regulator